MNKFNVWFISICWILTTILHYWNFGFIAGILMAGSTIVIIIFANQIKYLENKTEE